MKLLALSTSTPRATRRPRRRRIVGEAAYVDLQGHAERIFEADRRRARRGGRVGAPAIDAIACDVGPGSFTGVRVGRRLGQGDRAGARRCRSLGVVSLEAMAAAAFAGGAATPEDVVLAAIDAKKGEVFVAAYDASRRRCPRRRAVAREGSGALEALVRRNRRRRPGAPRGEPSAPGRVGAPARFSPTPPGSAASPLAAPRRGGAPRPGSSRSTCARPTPEPSRPRRRRILRADG